MPLPKALITTIFTTGKFNAQNLEFILMKEKRIRI
jgi:hypothetical protein